MANEIDNLAFIYPESTYPSLLSTFNDIRSQYASVLARKDAVPEEAKQWKTKTDSSVLFLTLIPVGD